MTHPGAPAASAEQSPVKQALLELRGMRARLAELEGKAHAPIAIVGLGMRFPGGANDPEHFWELLCAGAEMTSRAPTERWAGAGGGHGPSDFGAFLADIDLFAPEFFGIAPREAELMDPQQRLLLEVAWEALEHAGQSPQRLFGSQTGVFLGISNNDYLRRLLDERSAADLDTYWTSGNALSVAAGRLAYVLGLHGPAVALDTACSSSLVAVHQACQSLRGGETDLALAGGVNLILAPAVGLGFARAGMLASDGHCKSFDARADGYVRGEGCGLIVLKRLEDAEANGDNVLAVIRGSAVNQDGRSGGLTAPNGPAQEAVIRSALAQANVAPQAIGYLEAHGTGTSLGDPIEVQAAAAVLAAGRLPDAPLMLGTVKANIGHLESAAGIAGLIKAVLCLQHGQIPPQINVAEPNPYIAWHALALRVPLALTPWHSPDGQLRMAGVSSFGLSGTNAHVILQAAKPKTERPQPGPGERSCNLLPLSARDPRELAILGQHYAELMARQPQLVPADVCLTAATGRSHFEYRLAVVGATLEDLRTGLDSVGSVDGPVEYAAASESPEVAFLFSGQGNLAAGVGQELYATEPAFRAAFDRCDALAAPVLGGSLVAALYPIGDSLPGALDADQAYAQAGLFALQYALVELWKSWGVAPSMVLGHSVGEVAAACTAGVLSLESALRLVLARGRLMQTLPDGGAMVAVQMDEAGARRMLAASEATSISLAAINAADSVVLSGDSGELQLLLDGLVAQGVETRRLDIRLAAHSMAVDPLLVEFESIAASLTMRSPNVGMVSGVTGQPENAEMMTAAYWSRNLREPVRFADGVRSLWEAGCRVFVEIGPHATLLGLGRRCLPGGAATWLPSLHRERSDQRQMLDSLGTLYTLGAEIDWAAREAGRGSKRVPLPTYPWRRQRYWALAEPVAPEVYDARLAFEAAAQAASEQATQGPLDLELAEYPERWRRLSALATAYIARCLVQRGAFTHAGDVHTLDSVLRLGGIVPACSRLVGRWLDHLVSDGLLEALDGGVYRSASSLSAERAAPAERAAEPVMRGMPVLWAYIRRCGDALDDIVTGKSDALGTLFPDGSSATADYLYHEWPVAQYCNGIARAALTALARRHVASGRPLRILEIGAGTGGTTRALLPPLAELALLGAHVDYVVSDVSDFFLARAQAHAQTLPGLRTQLLDIERDPVAQGFQPHAYDVVIAANVLHATVDLDEALKHTRGLLAPGGSLILYETTRHPHWLDVTTGLIAGWQRFQDTWRSDHPLLDMHEWQRALASVGFEGMVALPEAGSASEILGQGVLLATTPGQSSPVQSSMVQTQPAVLEHAVAERLHPDAAASQSASEGADGVAARWLAALPDERRELLVDFVRAQVAVVLRTGRGQTLGRDRRLMDLGLDSLMAIELRNRIETGLGGEHKLPATLMFDYPSIAALAAYLDDEILATQPSTTRPPSFIRHTPPSPASPSVTSSADVATMSEDEVERLLLERLATL